MQLQSNHTSRATNILTCLILPYTALQNKHVLTCLCGDIISGVEGMPHVQNQSLSKFLCGMTGCRITPPPPDVGSLISDAQKDLHTFGRRPATRQHVAEKDTNLYGSTETQIPIPYPFPTSQEAVESDYTKMYGGKAYSMTSGIVSA